jgi:hypothetical protein
VKSNVASRPGHSDSAICGASAPCTACWFSSGTRSPFSARKLSAAAITSGVTVPRTPFSPTSVTGAATAGVATSWIAVATSSAVVVGGSSIRGNATAPPFAQSRCRTSADAATSSRWPGCGSAGCGCVPSKRTDPSTGSRSTTGPSCSSAWPSAASSTVVSTPTSRSLKNEVIRVIGFSGWEPASAKVAAQSTDSPAAAGSISPRASPTVTGIGPLVRAPISERSRCSASVSAMPPTPIPATVTPRGTDPELSSRSAP